MFFPKYFFPKFREIFLLEGFSSFFFFLSSYNTRRKNWTLVDVDDFFFHQAWKKILLCLSTMIYIWMAPEKKVRKYV